MKRAAFILVAVIVAFMPGHWAMSGPCHVCVSPVGSVVPPIGFWDEKTVSNSLGRSIDPDVAIGVSTMGG